MIWLTGSEDGAEGDAQASGHGFSILYPFFYLFIWLVWEKKDDLNNSEYFLTCSFVTQSPPPPFQNDESDKLINV